MNTDNIKFTKYKTDMGMGEILFAATLHGTGIVCESQDPMMPVGTEFPVKDLKTLKCEVTEV
ncbi:MAG: hypothetical protein ACRDCE_04235 [Cetobacterium sp.]|uniref:hypothetical protein n=1 Tax=Cetobacterium sp. TaxID=2071632 RepID=UPI003EE4CF4B